MGSEARERAYRAFDLVHWSGKFGRRDVGLPRPVHGIERAAGDEIVPGAFQGPTRTGARSGEGRFG